MHSPLTKESQEPFLSPPAPIVSQSQPCQDKTTRAENGTAPPRKRQKIDLACEECRSRKVRCDGLRPECSVCKRREKTCIYLPESKLTGSRRYVPLLAPVYVQQESKRLMSSTRVLHSLRDRVACLEAKANGVSAPKTLVENPESSTRLEERLPWQSSQMVNAGPSPSQSQKCATDSIVVKPQQNVPCSSVVVSTTSPSEDATTDIETLSPDQDLGAISAMGIALPATETPTDTTKEFYGKPSAASLLCDILSHGQRPSKQDSTPQPPPTSSRRSLSVPYSSNTDAYHLPPRHVADSLLEIYRERVQIIYPFLHWQTLMEAYNRLWLSETEVKNLPHLTGVGLGGPNCPVPVFYCALNAAFALATQFTDGSAHDRKERSTPFLRRSRHLMRLDFLDTAHIALIQALLILARYLQSTNLPNRCWNVAGIAYRMAQSLGLHVAVNERNTSELELEVRRRVWHSCVSLDTYDRPPSCILLPIFLTSLFCRVLGMLTGRPISNSTASMVPLPSVSDEEFSTYRPVSCQHSENVATTATFFAEAIKLSHILNRILGHIYDPWKKYEDGTRTELDKGQRYREHVSITMAFDDELDRFEIELPEVLRWPNEILQVHAGDILAQQRHVLRTR
ncbi:transcription activator acu-15 [Fusarium beomiforme]|uniref:Transcription activator acu-15 n=1 Tax=Fusarium beomiforme TaxID=44412 RepID=A0A9P5AE73_9HYPO|nr:transcription activator acu-15 [Fusarium beomiforme]